MMATEERCLHEMVRDWCAICLGHNDIAYLDTDEGDAPDQVTCCDRCGKRFRENERVRRVVDDYLCEGCWS
jgi:hypothetical protein